MRHLLSILAIVFFVSLHAQQPELTVQLGHSKLIYDVAYSSDGKYIASASADRTVKIWETEKGREIKTMYISEGYATSVAFSKDNKYLLVGGGSYDIGLLIMYDIAKGDIVREFRGHNEYVWKAKFSQDETCVYSVSFDYTIKMWNAKTGELLHSTANLNGINRDLSIDPKGEWLATTNDKDSVGVTFWSLKDLSFHARLELPDSFEPRAVTFSTNGNYIIVANFNKDVAVYERNSLQPFLVFEGHSDYIMDILADKEETSFFTSSMDRLINQWDIKTGELIHSFQGHKDKVYAIDLHPTENKLISGGSFDKSILEWDIKTASITKKYSGNIYPVNKLILSEDGNTLFVNSYDDYGGDVYVWQLDRLNKVENVGDLYQAYHFIDVNKDNLLIANRWGIIQLRDTKDFSILQFTDSKGKLNYMDYDFQQKINDPQFIPGKKNMMISTEQQYDDSWSSTYFDIKELDPFKNSLKTISLEKDTIEGNQFIQFSPNGEKYYILESDYYHTVFHLVNSKELTIETTIADTSRAYSTFKVSPDEKTLIMGDYNTLSVWDLTTTQQLFIYEGLPPGYVTDIQFLSNNQVIIAGGDWSNGYISMFLIDQQKEIKLKSDFNSRQNDLAFDTKKRLLYCGSDDGKISVFNMDTWELELTLFTFADQKNEWAVIHPSGLFDGSQNGIEKYLYFTYLLEPIELFQLKERYYEPGLLQKVLGYNTEPIRNVSEFKNVALYPKAFLKIVEDQLNVTLEERSGGIGKISFFVNGKEMINDINSRFQAGAKGEPPFTVIDLNSYAKYMTYEIPNSIEIVTTNLDKSMTSPIYSIKYMPKAPSGFNSVIKRPQLHALIVGTSDYRGDILDLNFASKDAADFANAMSVGGGNLFGADNVHVYLLNSDQTQADLFPSKENIYKVLLQIAESAGPEDVFLMYFSGHGVTFGEQTVEFHYLTKDVSSGDINDPTVRENYTISSNDLVNWLNSIPAKKQIMILDACASGQAVEDLLSLSKNVESSQIKALDKMKDRTGLYIIAGSAANKVSYEASQYGQSLMTYSLLNGLNRIGLESEDNLVDLIDWINFSKEQVPELASTIGGIQEPVVALPRNLNSFAISKITTETLLHIASVKPVFIRSTFLELEEQEDVLGLSIKLDQYFQDISAKGKTAHFIYVDVPNFPEAYSIKGIYEINNNQVTIKATLRKGSIKLESFEIEDTNLDPQHLVSIIIKKIEGMIKE